MTRLLRTSLFLVVVSSNQVALLAAAGSSPARAAEPSPRGIEFFEKKVRPILVEHCHSCHSVKAKKKRGGLRIDSRADLLKGGDTGPALVPGHPEQSRLIVAVSYKDVDLQMPPRKRLSAAAIADLTAWVKMGAPWPDSATPRAGGGAEKVFDLYKRRQAHWSWRPIRAATPPAVRDTAWPLRPLDRFILARLEGHGLRPAARADRLALIRRLSFDLVGLPPTPEAMGAFERDNRPDAVERLVDRLLASPRFGERWGRHWLDLVRYAETKGHEFDYPIPNAHHYRDYVLRALNADLPYDRLVREHIAGDLLPRPRLHPGAGFNESILGTGFWFLGEELHSPVDVRADQADRFDNRIDVFGKAFLGLTIACARCHDHKFDAISTRDYYSLFGFLASSNYRQVRFDSLEHNRQVARDLGQLRERTRPAVAKALAGCLRPGVEQTADYRLAAREALLARPETAGAEVVFEDFESGTYASWKVTGTAFGKGPQTLATIAPYQGRINAVGKYFVNSHNIRAGGKVRAGDGHTGKMTSKSFTIRHDYITLLVGGGAHIGKTCVNLVVADKVILSATGRNSNLMFPVCWDVRRWRGQAAHLEIIDDHRGAWGNIGVDHIVFTDRAEASSLPTDAGRVEAIARAHKLDAARLGRWVACLRKAARDSNDPLHAWAVLARDGKPDGVEKRLVALSESARRREAEATARLKGAQVIVDYTGSGPAAWLPDDVTFGPGPVRPGQLQLPDEPGGAFRLAERGAARFDPFWKDLKLAPGTENEPGAVGQMVRSGRTIRTPAFKLTSGKLYYLVRGGGLVYAAVSDHLMIAGPLHARLVQPLPASEGFRWVAHDLSVYRGLPVHVEFTANPRAEFAVALVVQAERAPGPVAGPIAPLLKRLEGARSLDSLAKGYRRLLLDTLVSLETGTIETRHSDRARLANWMLEQGELFGLGAPETAGKLEQATRPYLEGQAKLAARVRRSSRLAPAMQDGNAFDEHVFVRGSHKTPGPVAPRRFLEALAGPAPLKAGSGSGRLELAEQLTDPDRNPFLARVLVNRVWHHLFGRGLVVSVDDMGIMGQPPTHPELLDYLADRFVRDGWSIKKLIREMVLSASYRMSSVRGGPGDRTDPENLLLHRMRMRRLEGEAIRDAMLAVSGRLDRRMFGPSVPVYLTDFQQGRGRPASGPLDGAGRRSVYLAVRRNFLSSLLLAFDTPAPFSTVGRRTVSNVPAQSLILMNDPFIHQQAGLWARRVLARPGSMDERLTEMYRSAFGRSPSGDERKACREFLAGAPTSVEAWSDLAHALFNVKEFIFLP